MAVYTYTYTNTHTVTGNPDFDYWQTGSPTHGNTFTFDNFTLSVALGVDVRCSVYGNNGPGAGSIFATRRVTAGNTTSFLESSPLTIPAGTTQFQLRTTPLSNYSTPYPTYTETAVITWTNAPVQPACAYGAELKSSSAISTAVNLELLLAVAAAMGLGPEAILFWGFMMGWPLIVPICNSVPNLPSAILDSDFIDGTFIPNPTSLGKFVDAFQYGLWEYYCECKPAPTGNPPPVNPPQQTFPTRITNITFVSSVCSNADICTYLTYMTRLIISLNLSITNNNYLNANPPYVLGTSHAGLSGNGEFAVSGILGAFVSFTTLPSRVGYRVGDPNEVWTDSYLSFGTSDGWYPSVKIDHNPWLILPQFMANVVKIGYSIPADTVLTLTELVPRSLAIPQGP